MATRSSTRDKLSEIVHYYVIRCSTTTNTAEQAKNVQQWLAAIEPFVTDGDDPRACWLRELVDQLRRTVAGLHQAAQAEHQSTSGRR